MSDQVTDKLFQQDADEINRLRAELDEARNDATQVRGENNLLHQRWVRSRDELAEKDKRIAELERNRITEEQITEIFQLCRCRCEPCWTDRDLHSPDCMEEVLDVLGIVACSKCGGSGVEYPAVCCGDDPCPACNRNGVSHGWVWEEEVSDE